MLGGLNRSQLFDELKLRHRSTPLVTEGYREFIRQQLDAFEQQNPALLKGVTWALVATAVVRPAISVGLAVVGAHGMELAAGHWAISWVGDVAVGTATAAAGEAVTVPTGQFALKTLLSGLFARFYEERVKLLTKTLDDLVLGPVVERLNRLSHVRDDLLKQRTDRLVKSLRITTNVTQRSKSLTAMPTFDDWSAQLRLADFDRLVDGVRHWVETSPPWPPFDRARAVWARIAPRVEQLRVDLDRVLVVGVVGGTGTGKSTLLNALVGQRICQAGDVVRPTTRRPVVLTQPDLDMSFLQLDDCQPEVHRLTDVPLLSQMVLVDCPDPDTQSRQEDGAPTDEMLPSAEANGNLDLLRRILPHCDVLVCTGTAQKYKTHAVLDELLRNAPGRQIVFVQTHKAVDADITADWQRHLQSHGFTVPHMFRIDSEEALDRLQAHRPAPAEFSALVDFLRTELAERGPASNPAYQRARFAVVVSRRSYSAKPTRSCRRSQS